MKKILQIEKSVRFEADLSLVSGSHRWCDSGFVRFFSIFFVQHWGKFDLMAGHIIFK